MANNKSKGSLGSNGSGGKRGVSSYYLSSRIQGQTRPKKPAPKTRAIPIPKVTRQELFGKSKSQVVQPTGTGVGSVKANAKTFGSAKPSARSVSAKYRGKNQPKKTTKPVSKPKTSSWTKGVGATKPIRPGASRG